MRIHLQEELCIVYYKIFYFITSNDTCSKNNWNCWRSDKNWQDAAQAALNEAKKTIHGITGVEVGDMTAKVDPNTGNITEYHTAVKIAFGVEH